MGNLKSKLDVRHEAARLALASEAKDFTKSASEIYNFITEGIELPDTYDENAAQMEWLDALRGMSPPSPVFNNAAVSSTEKPN